MKEMLLAALFVACSLMGGMASRSLKPHQVFSGQFHAEAVFSDAGGRPSQVFSATPEPVESMIGPEGGPRLEMGLEQESVAGETPFLKFSNNRGELRVVYRLKGTEDEPLIVMKDRRGRDRIVIGLDERDAGEEPFLALLDADGAAHMVFGPAPEAAPK
jgi:hypothetical protein